MIIIVCLLINKTCRVPVGERSAVCHLNLRKTGGRKEGTGAVCDVYLNNPQIQSHHLRLASPTRWVHYGLCVM